MKATIDSGGRVLIPKQLRDALGLVPGSQVSITPYSAGVNIVPGGPTARLVEVDGRLVARSQTVVTDDMVRALRDPLARW